MRAKGGSAAAGTGRAARDLRKSQLRENEKRLRQRDCLGSETEGRGLLACVAGKKAMGALVKPETLDSTRTLIRRLRGLTVSGVDASQIASSFRERRPIAAAIRLREAPPYVMRGRERCAPSPCSICFPKVLYARRRQPAGVPRLPTRRPETRAGW